MTTRKQRMDAAKRGKNDEFYTQLTTIEKEMSHYFDHFKDKVVYCNCDDPYSSQFWFYFANQFERLGLKKLVATCYRDDYLGVLTGGEKKQACKVEYTGSKRGERKFFMDEATFTPLKGNGDFRNQENIDILRECDIVVTNPPFSLFREFVERLIREEKKFLILGNNNAVSYKDIFSLIKANKMWLGFNSNKSVEFGVPESYPLRGTNNRIDDEGNKFITVPAISWFTNLEHDLKHREMVLTEYYDKAKYPKYENYDAINVDKAKLIPRDYKGAMGVPITFLCKHNQKQFEIIALGIVGSIDFSSNRKMEILDKDGNSTGKYTFNAKGTLYKKHDKNDKKPPAFKDVENGNLYSSIYARIIIRNRKPE